MDFEAEDTAFLLGTIDQTEAIRRRRRTSGVISPAVAVVLMLCSRVSCCGYQPQQPYRRALERANRDTRRWLRRVRNLMLASTHRTSSAADLVMGYIDLLSRLTTGNTRGTFTCTIEGVRRATCWRWSTPAGLLPSRYQQGRRRQRAFQLRRHNCSRRSSRFCGHGRMQRASPLSSKPGRGPGTM